MSTWTNTDFLAHQQRQQDLQRAAQRQQLAHEAHKARHSWTNDALATLGRRLEQWGAQLQAQARTSAYTPDTTLQGV